MRCTIVQHGGGLPRFLGKSTGGEKVAAPDTDPRLEEAGERSVALLAPLEGFGVQPAEDRKRRLEETRVQQYRSVEESRSVLPDPGSIGVLQITRSAHAILVVAAAGRELRHGCRRQRIGKRPGIVCAFRGGQS